MQTFIDTAEVAPPRRLFTRRASGNPFLLRDKGLELRLASTRFERIEAQRLRFEVFNLELQLGLTTSLASGGAGIPGQQSDLPAVPWNR